MNKAEETAKAEEINKAEENKNEERSNIAELFGKSVAFHGHQCPGLAIGVRAAVRGAKNAGRCAFGGRRDRLRIRK